LTRPDPFPPSTPEAQGISSAAVLAFVRAAQARVGGVDSFMLLRHGHLVASGWWSPYAPEYPHELFSLTKSSASTAVGLAVAEGRLSVDNPVLSRFAEDAPADVSEHLAAMRVRHLLTMTVGHEEEPSRASVERSGERRVKALLE
jgi:CubicO group peptidase (beta-lactamase class C family)